MKEGLIEKAKAGAFRLGLVKDDVTINSRELIRPLEPIDIAEASEGAPGIEGTLNSRVIRP